MTKLSDYFQNAPNTEDSKRLGEKIFLNGDIYVGDFKETTPHGKGKYTWSDRTVYDGDWEEGKMTGKGEMSWPSGATYEGDFSGGYLHGFGTLTEAEGSAYTGAWRMNIPHGIGRKEYPNSDVYDGAWKEGVHEGNGRYSWNSGNTYVGNWKSGKMCGKGVMKWAKGDHFDGLWLNGFRHGSGVYRFADGEYYFGIWSRDVKDGKGTYYPAGSKDPSLQKFCISLEYNDDEKKTRSHILPLDSECNTARSKTKHNLPKKVSVGGTQSISGRTSIRNNLLDEKSSSIDHAGDAGDVTCDDSSCTLSCSSDIGQREEQENSYLVYEREYVQGVLIKERVRNRAQLSHKSKQCKKLRVKRVLKRSRVNIFDGQGSYYLMLNLQLGIRYTVGKITPVHVRDVRASDFGERARLRMYFPRKGSQLTPPHYSINFYWKDYCPMVFRSLREMFKLDAADYMMSICGDDGLKEISSPGKSGSIFYLSHDDKFVIKTVKRSELKALLKMLPNYFNHVQELENTLITKFFGLHRITLRGGKKVIFVVMGNMFCTELTIHRRYDLKGSTIGRFTDKDKIHKNTTLKDLDLSYELHTDKLLRKSLLEQISRDCMFLKSQQIIDYSLLLGLHFRAPEHGLVESSSSSKHLNFSSNDDHVTSEGELTIPQKGLLLVPSCVRPAPGPHIRGTALRAFSVGEKEVDIILPGSARLAVQLGVNMPAQAQANKKVALAHEEGESEEDELFEVYDVVLYMGIIDILQQYNLKKKAEHAWKSLKFDPHLISAVEPKLYAKRFFEFLNKIFPDQECMSLIVSVPELCSNIGHLKIGIGDLDLECHFTYNFQYLP